MASFTHTGYRDHIGHAHCGSRLHGHRLPKPGETHALNAGGRAGFVTLCGKTVRRAKAYTEYGDLRRSVMGNQEARHYCQKTYHVSYTFAKWPLIGE